MDRDSSTSLEDVVTCDEHNDVCTSQHVGTKLNGSEALANHDDDDKDEKPEEPKVLTRYLSVRGQQQSSSFSQQPLLPQSTLRAEAEAEGAYRGARSKKPMNPSTIVTQDPQNTHHLLSQPLQFPPEYNHSLHPVQEQKEEEVEKKNQGIAKKLTHCDISTWPHDEQDEDLYGPGTSRSQREDEEARVSKSSTQKHTADPDSDIPERTCVYDGQQWREMREEEYEETEAKVVGGSQQLLPPQSPPGAEAEAEGAVGGASPETPMIPSTSLAQDPQNTRDLLSQPLPSPPECNHSPLPVQGHDDETGCSNAPDEPGPQGREVREDEASIRRIMQVINWRDSELPSTLLSQVSRYSNLSSSIDGSNGM